MSFFAKPISFPEAVKFLRDKDLMPTALSHKELKALGKAVDLRSLHAARLTNASVLQEMRKALDIAIRPQMAPGELTDMATLRKTIQDTILGEGYDPETGFPGEGADIPPAARGSLRDLSSSARIKLITETQVRQAFGFGQHKQALTGAAVDSFPCWELIRIYDRQVERGFRVGAKGALVPVDGDDWPSRWEAAGGDFFDGGRMIARKDDPVWQNLGDGMGGYEDTLGNPYPPFAFSSGMGVTEISRDEAIELGVIGEGDEVESADPEFKAGMAEDAAGFDLDFLKALEGDLGGMLK